MNYLKYLWIMLAALLGPANAEESHLQYGEWTASRIGGGGYLTNLTFAPSDSNIIYCVGDVGGLFKSTDGGKKWHMIHGTTYPAFYFVRGVDVDPRDSDTLLVMAKAMGPTCHTNSTSCFHTDDTYRT